MDLLRRSNIPDLKTIQINGMRRNWHYEVVSQCIMDLETMDDYPSLNIAHEHLGDNAELTVMEDYISEENQIAFRYELSDENDIDILNAKKCGFGVIKVLKGKYENRQYMYPLHSIRGSEVAMELFCYAVLTHKFADKSMINKMKDKKFVSFFKDTVGHELFNEVQNLLEDCVVK